MLVPFNGLVNWDIIGMMMIVMLGVYRPISPMAISIWEIHSGWLLRHWLISAIWPSWGPWSLIWEGRRPGLQGPERLSPLRILPRPLPSSVLSSTVLTPWTILWSASSSRDSPRPVLGAVSTSSTESISKCCQLLLNNFSSYLARRPKAPHNATSKAVTSASCPHSPSSSQWTPATQAEHNSPTTWKPFSVQ